MDNQDPKSPPKVDPLDVRPISAAISAMGEHGPRASLDHAHARDYRAALTLYLECMARIALDSAESLRRISTSLERIERFNASGKRG